MDAAANLVSEAVHPEANIIFGTTYDEGMEDEIRITVIATNFEEHRAAGVMPTNPFTVAGERQAAAAPQPQVQVQPQVTAPVTAAVTPAAEPVVNVAPAQSQPQQAAPAAEGGLDDDGWGEIFQIFNQKH